MAKVEDLLMEYLAIREDLDKARKEWQELEKKLKDRQDQIQMQFREIADELGVDSLSCKGVGTAYRTVKEYYRVGDWDRVLNYIRDTNNWQMLEKRIAKLATKEIYDETGQLPPGVDYAAEVDFVVRKG